MPLEQIKSNSRQRYPQGVGSMNDFDLKPIPNTSRKRKAKRDARNKIAGVYFLEAPKSGLVKIGRTVDIHHRMTQVKVTAGAPDEELRIWGYVSCARASLSRLEAEMHKEFSEERKAGEWFEVFGGAVLSRAIGVASSLLGDEYKVVGLMSDMEPGMNDIERELRERASFIKASMRPPRLFGR